MSIETNKCPRCGGTRFAAREAEHVYDEIIAKYRCLWSESCLDCWYARPCNRPSTKRATVTDYFARK